MTDPVDTDALRDMKATENLWPENAALVDAAADEVDRLRVSDSNATQQRDQLANALRRSDDENDRLRAVIENAPHAGDCGLNETGWNNQPIGLPCTCWKADAL